MAPSEDCIDIISSKSITSTHIFRIKTTQGCHSKEQIKFISRLIPVNVITVMHTARTTFDGSYWIRLWNAIAAMSELAVVDACGSTMQFAKRNAEFCANHALLNKIWFLKCKSQGSYWYSTLFFYWINYDSLNVNRWVKLVLYRAFSIE